MKRPMITLAVLVAACAGATYVLTRHPSGRDAGNATAVHAPPASSPGDRTKVADRKERTQEKPKRVSFDEKLKATLPPDLDPAQAKVLMAAFIAGTPDMGEQNRYSILLMEKLCDNGYSGEADALIPEGRGLLRECLIMQYFAYADLPDSQLLDKLGRLTRLHDMVPGFRSYLGRFSPEELAAASSSEKLRDILKNVNPKRWQVHLNQAVRDSLIMKLYDDAGANSAILSTAAEMNAKGLLDSAEYLEVVGADSRTSAFDKWERLHAINPSTARDQDDKNEIRGSRDDFIFEMIREDAPQTLDLLLKSPAGDMDRDLTTALNRWIDIHSAEPSNWFTDNRGRMNVRQRTVAADVFVKKALKVGEFEGARQWAQEIPDEARRTKALAEIEVKQSGKQKQPSDNQK